MPILTPFYVLATDAVGCSYEWAEFHAVDRADILAYLADYGIYPIYLRAVAL